jgi:hypothetical protein
MMLIATVILIATLTEILYFNKLKFKIVLLYLLTHRCLYYLLVDICSKYLEGGCKVFTYSRASAYVT